MKQIFMKYGKNLHVEAKIQGTKEKKIRRVEFTNFTNLRRKTIKKNLLYP
jgi:hypothetical protein